MLKCCICHKQITGYYYNDWQGNKWCAEHSNTTKCFSCGSVLTNPSQYIQVEPNRLVCKNCIANEVTPDNFNWVKQQVINRLIKVGFQDIQCDWINFKVVSKKEMDMLCQNAAGLHTACSILNQTVFVLSHTNKIEFAAILAHELLHSWQMQNNLNEYANYNTDDISKKVCEGFAQMGSFLIYSTIEHEYAKWRLEQMFRYTDEVYGIPFIKIHERFKQIGWYGIIKEARQQKLARLL